MGVLEICSSDKIRIAATIESEYQLSHVGTSGCYRVTASIRFLMNGFIVGLLTRYLKKCQMTYHFCNFDLRQYSIRKNRFDLDKA